MTPYIVTFFILVLLSMTQFIKKLKKYKLVFFLFASVYLICFAGFRKLGVGADDISYYNMFIYRAPELYDWLFGKYTYDIKQLYMEPGYVFINSFLRLFTDNYTVLFLTIASISIGIASYNYFRYSKYVSLSLLLFFVHTFLYRDINQIRAAIAAAIALSLIKYIDTKEHIKVWITLFIMSLFHMASLSLVIAYFTSFINLTKKRAILIYSSSVMFGYIGIGKLIVKLIPGDGFTAMKLYSYTEDKRYISSLSLFDITNIKNSLILFVIFVFWNRLEKVIPYFKTMILFYLLAVAIRIAFYDLGVITARISTFFGIVEVIIIPYFIYLFRQKRLVLSVIILYAFMILYLNLFVKEGRYPYELSLF